MGAWCVVAGEGVEIADLTVQVACRFEATLAMVRDSTLRRRVELRSTAGRRVPMMRA